MPTYTQLPGSLGLAFRRGDQFGTTIDFSADLTGHAVTSHIVSAVTGQTVTAITTTLADASAGVVGLGLTEAQTAGLAAGTYSWRLEWVAPGDVKRTALAGVVEVTA